MFTKANEGKTARRRMMAYVAVGVVIAIIPIQHDIAWRSSAEFHTVMESVATLLALIVGAMAMVRYYAKKDFTIFLIGVGFLCTASLDGFHGVFTSSYFKAMLPEDMSPQIAWSWIASRQYLAVLMAISWLVWRRGYTQNARKWVSEGRIFMITGLVALACMLFFIFTPLPRSYYDEYFFHRPEEFAPAVFFLIALVGYLRKGSWRTDSFEHWLVLSLIVGTIGQAGVMSQSSQVFDFEFDAAHVLKLVEYLCVLTGLMINMSDAFQRVVDDGERIRTTLNTIVDGIITIDEYGAIQSINPAGEQIFGYGAEELLGRNISMLAAEPYRGAHDSFISHYRQGGAPKVIGLGREVEGQRKNGTVFPMELFVSDMRIGGELMFVGVTRDISQRKSMERVKNEFISTVSHELRTPLTSINGSLGLIRSGALDELPDKRRELIDIAHHNSERLVRLINDILDIEKIEAGFIDDQMEPIDLMALIVSAVAANKGFSQKFGVRYVFIERIEDAYILGNRDRLMQVMANLLSNAVKYSPAGGHVDIAVSRRNGKIHVEVTDRGPGIPEAFHDRIFEKFAQADSSDNRQKGGTGLGLSICKAIIDRCGGDIGFETAEDIGTTFYFELPALNIMGEETATSDLLPEPSGARVLICEDDPDTAQRLSILLQADGCQTDIAFCAAQAKTMLATGDYAAMTLDLGLPDQDGVALIGELRANPVTRNLPIIVVSIKADEGEKRLNGDAFGIIDWMMKPIDPVRLRDNLKRALDYLPGDKARVLHVEDNSDIRKIIAMIIGDDAAVISVKTLQEAKKILIRERFDLMILDLNLPDGSGEELISLINQPGKPCMPVIVFSANPLTRGLADRVSSVLVKSRTTNEKLAKIIRSHTMPINRNRATS